MLSDFHYRSLHSKIAPLVIFKDPEWYRGFMVRAVPGSTQSAIDAGQKVWKEFFPGAPFEYYFLDDAFNQMYQQDRRTAILIFTFAIIAVVISSLGLFGLTAFMAARRTREIGIRKVLGASIANITSMLSKDFVRLVFVAILLGLPIAFWALHQWLEGFAYRMPLSWWIFALTGIIATGLAVLTISFQAIKAAIANPATSLRSE